MPDVRIVILDMVNKIVNESSLTSQTIVPSKYFPGISSRISPGNRPDSIACKDMTKHCNKQLVSGMINEIQQKEAKRSILKVI